MRTYKPVRPKSGQRARMGRAVRLRGEGLSLRQIAAKQGVSYETVRRDLAMWARMTAQVSHLPVTKMPPGGGNVTGPGAGNVTAEVVPLRRTS